MKCVPSRQAENKAVLGGRFGGEHRARRHGNEKQVFLCLEKFERFQHDPGVASANGESHLLLEHQLLGQPQALIWSGFVVACNEFHQTPEITPHLVDFFYRQLRAQTRAVTKVLRCAAERAGETNAYWLPRGRSHSVRCGRLSLQACVGQGKKGGNNGYPLQIFHFHFTAAFSSGLIQ